MCRILGIVASEPTEFRIVLREVPRSLAALSAEHPDGWGLAIYDESSRPDVTRAAPWSVRKGIECARASDEFHREASGSRGVLLVSHVRQKTVGPTALENTHPFESDGWVFAHNGTIKDLEFVRARVSPARAAGIRGDTDSELFFAWVLTALDEAGLTRVGGAAHESGGALDERIKSLVAEARAREGFGAFNFLLSNGLVTFAHRFGRSLYILRRGPRDEVRREREIDGVTVETPWSQRRHAVFIASERMTDEPWEELPDGTLLRIDRVPRPRVSAL